MRGFNETFQADIVDMQQHSHENTAFTHLLTVIDVFSKFAWGVPGKSKSGVEITASMKSILI